MSTFIAITGHRHLTSEQEIWVKAQLQLFLERALSKLDDVKVISGMALGVDTLWAQLAIELKVPFHAYVPGKTQTGWRKNNGQWEKFTDRAWKESDRKEWLRLLWLAEEIIDCSTTFPPNNWRTMGSMLHHRNRCMVNKCAYLGGVWDGKRSGTSNCIEYAWALNRRVYFIDIIKQKSNWDSLPLDDKNNLIVKKR